MNSRHQIYIKSIHHGYQVPGTYQTLLWDITRGREGRKEDPIQRKSSMDSSHSDNILGLLPDPLVRNNVQ